MPCVMQSSVLTPALAELDRLHAEIGYVVARIEIQNDVALMSKPLEADDIEVGIRQIEHGRRLGGAP